MGRVVFLVGAALLGLRGGVAMAASDQEEHVLISGGVSLMRWEQYKSVPHDKWWMNFVRAARIRISQIREKDPQAQITWLVYRPAYVRRGVQEGKDLVPLVESVREKFGVRLVWFSKAREVIAYVNEGQDRERVKICDFEYFGHSNKACWMFDYSNFIDSASKAWLREEDFTHFKPGVFSEGAFAKSWGCHSGESMIRHFRKATGVRMWGVVGKTQYQTEELPIPATRWGRWKH